jgi:TonB-linked SusC/RagA family outer membrane protein
LSNKALPVKGKVIDKATGKPIVGASVVARGSNRGVSTNEGGSFAITLAADRGILIISSVGYKTTEQVIDVNSTDVTIYMISDEKGMEEVVVTALGIQRTAKSLTYATQRISGDQINQVRDANVANTLSGKVAGLTITPSANGPGGATRILLRGNRSIQGNNGALIVVDGVAIDNSTIQKQVRNDAGDDNGGQSGSDGVSSVNPDDIESINVLKGAAGAALYGSRAANGVVLITTKKGRSGRSSVSLNSGATLDQAMVFPKYQNDYAQGAGGMFSTNTGNSWGPKVAGQQVTDWTGKTVTLQDYPDNVKDFFKNGLTTNNAISASGGSDKIQTYLSYANLYAEGIVPKNHLLRNTFNTRVTYNITDRLTADLKVTYLLQNIYDKPGVGGDGQVAGNVFRMPRSVNLQDLKTYKTVDASGVETPTYWTNTDPVYMNPYWTVNNTHVDEDRSRVTGQASLKYKLTDWLNVQGRVSSDSYDDFITKKYANNTVNSARSPGGQYSEETDYIAERNIDFLLNGENNITPDLKVTYNVGGSLLSRQSRHRVNIASGLGINNKFDLGFATTLGVATAATKRQLNAVYGTAQLAFKNYLFLDLTARNDWSSTLPEPFSYFYPSVGLSAILSDMIKMPSWISFSKVSGSVTKVGNDADPYLLSQTYNYTRGAYGGYIGSNSTKSIGNLNPELTQSLELGTEWSFIDSRYGFAFTYYKTNSKNQLLNVSAPASSGYSSIFVNAGNIQNSGIEVMLTAKVIKSTDFKWDVGINYAYNENKVISLYPGVTQLNLGSSDNVRTVRSVVQEGGSYGDLYGYKWQKLNGQYVMNANGLPVVGSTIEYIGNANNKYTAGLTNTFTYRNWMLNVLVDGKFGGVVASGSVANQAYAGTGDFTTRYRAAGSWTLPGVLADGSKNATSINAEQFWQGVAQGDYSYADFFTYDATNVRLRELSLGYDFKRLPKILKMARLSFVARNVFFIYRGSSLLDIPGMGKRKMDFDPETSFGNSNYQGIQYYNLPSSRSMGLNLKLSF